MTLLASQSQMDTLYIVLVVVGTAVAVITMVAAATSVFWRTRFNSPSEWRSNYLAERQKNDDLENEVAKQRQLKHDALAQVAALRAATDLTGLMRALSDNHTAQTSALTAMEQKLEAQTEVLHGLVGTVQALVKQSR